jgi:hypothetical protein
MRARARSTWLLSVTLAIAGTTSLAAQRAEPGFYRWELTPTVPRRDTLPLAQGDYRYEGLVFGGLVFGALGAWLGSRDYASCPTVPGGGCSGNTDKLVGAVALGALGAAAGGGLGYLVGRFSPKKPRPDTLASRQPRLGEVPDSIRIRTGYQHWRGAGIGLAIGTGVGALTGAFLSSFDWCSDCEEPSIGEGAVMVGLLGASVGGVVGFLAGLSSPKYITVPNSPN